MNESKPDPLQAVPPMPPSGRDVYVDSADSYPSQAEPHMARRSASGRSRTFVLVAAVMVVLALASYWLM